MATIRKPDTHVSGFRMSGIWSLMVQCKTDSMQDAFGWAQKKVAHRGEG
jgi:hypothetical protein